MKSFGSIVWLTNIDYIRPADFPLLVLDKTFDPMAYPFFDNLPAVSVTRIKDIPKDYKGLIGVSPSFLLHYDPEQFEIVAMDYELAQDILLPDGKIGRGRCYLNNERKYARIIIRLKDEGYQSKIDD